MLAKYFALIVTLLSLSPFAKADGLKCPRHFIVDYAFDDAQVEDWVRAHSREDVKAAMANCEAIAQKAPMERPDIASDIRYMNEFIEKTLAKIAAEKPEPTLPTIKMNLAQKVRKGIKEEKIYYAPLQGVWETTSIQCKWPKVTDYRRRVEDIHPESRIQASKATLTIGCGNIGIDYIFKLANGRIADQGSVNYPGFLGLTYVFQDPHSEDYDGSDQCLETDLGAIACAMSAKFNPDTEILTLYKDRNLPGPYGTLHRAASPLDQLCEATHESADRVQVTLRKVGEL